MTRIITIDQKDKWNEYIENSFQSDFYHTWSYHSIDQTGDPLLFVYEENNLFIAFPLIKRKIDNSPYFDLTSVYGYTGPVSNTKFDEINELLIKNFQNEFLTFLQKGNYVSVFSRLNPFFNQESIVQCFGGLYYNGKTVAIDLTSSHKEQTSNYRRAFHGNIKKLRKLGYIVKEGNSIEDIRTFVSIYTENMDRIGASESYYFSEDYFRNILESKEYQSKLLMAYNDDDLAVAGMIITCINGIIQAHLLSTRTEFLHLSPAKLLVDEATIIGRELNMKYYHLGGGVGFKEDSLFNWKSGFSDLHLPYYTWRYIVNEPVYNSLLEKANIEKSAEIDFFPLYRSGFRTSPILVE
ncbi:GNAT family N-acetyltransferase [Pedobacter sp. P351]|uniref:GNAT family N-acetyltransferase n=1 Tax=Pedobacter superstes TaxID=3133441 RepID=UPI0030A51E6F